MTGDGEYVASPTLEKIARALEAAGDATKARVLRAKIASRAGPVLDGWIETALRLSRTDVAVDLASTLQAGVQRGANALWVAGVAEELATSLFELRGRALGYAEP